MIEDLYDSAIVRGMDQEVFWHLTLGEIRTYIKTRDDNSVAEFKQQLLLLNFEAVRTAEYVSCIFSKDNKVGSYYEKFPDLFKEEIQAHIDSEMEANIARAKSFAEHHNREYLDMEGGEEDG